MPRVISCLVGVSSEGPPLVYFYSFLFLPASFPQQGGAGGSGNLERCRIVPLLLNTLAHNRGSVKQAPNVPPPP